MKHLVTGLILTIFIEAAVVMAQNPTASKPVDAPESAAGPPPEVKPFAASLVGHWRLDETEGVEAADASGRHAGRCKGGVKWAKGWFQGAAAVNGKDAQIVLGDLGRHAEATLSFWIKARDMGSDRLRGLVTSPSWGQGILHLPIRAGRIEGYLHLGGSGRAKVKSPHLKNGRWTHVAVTMSTLKGMFVLYVNGKRVSEAGVQGLRALDLRDMVAGYEGKDRYFDGMIDEIVILSRAVSPAAIAYLAGHDKKPLPDDLLAGPEITDRPAQAPAMQSRETAELESYPAPEFPQGSVVKVFLLGGQSNMRGGSPIADLPAELQGAQNSVIFFHAGRETDLNKVSLTALHPDGGFRGDRFGPEVTFGYTIAKAFPDQRFAFLKYGHGGSSMSHWSPRRGPMYKRFQKVVADGLAALREAGYKPEIVGMLWHQGEADRRADSRVYEKKLTAFIADIRDKYGAQLPFLIGGINQASPCTKNVTEAQIAVAESDPLAAFVSSKDLTCLDEWHFDTPSMMKLGERFADAYIQHFSGTSAAPVESLYVASDATDHREAGAVLGSRHNPFPTIQSAINATVAVSSEKEVHVILMDGSYNLSRSIQLSSKHSRTIASPLVIRAETPKMAHITFANSIDREDFTSADNSKLGYLLQGKAKPHVVVAKIEPALRSVLARVRSSQLSSGPYQLMQSRWPNKGFAHIKKVYDKGAVWTKGRTPGPRPKGSAGKPIGGVFSTHEQWSGDWKKEIESGQYPKISGYFSNDWYYDHNTIASVDGGKIQALASSRYGFYNKRPSPRKIVVSDLLSEIDVPGEWFYDEGNADLYVWPIDGSSSINVIIRSDIIKIKNATNIFFEGIVFEKSEDGILISGGRNIQIKGCLFRNLTHCAVRIEGGKDHVVASSDFHSLNTAADITGTSAGNYEWDLEQDPPRIIPDGFVFHNNHVYDCVGSRGISLKGVGITVSHNLFHDMPGSAFIWKGNDNIFEYNEFYSLLKRIGDWGVLYSSAGWTSWGNEIRYNFIHHVITMPGLHAVNGLYFDQFDSGDIIHSNVFYKAGHRAVLINNGSGQRVTNNLFINGYIDIFITNKYTESVRSQREEFDSGKRKRGDVNDFWWRTERVVGVDGWREGPWADAYPLFKEMMSGDAYAPTQNSVKFNGHTNPIHSKLALKAVPEGMVSIEGNFDLDLSDYKDPSILDFNIANKSKLPEGFEEIPFDKIGLIKTEHRTALPNKAIYRAGVKQKNADRPPHDSKVKYDWRRINDLFYEDKPYWD